MGTGRDRLKAARLRQMALMAVGLLATAVVVTPAVGGSAARAVSSGLGSSCAYPWRASYVVGGPGGGFEGDQKHIEMGGTPRKLTWDVWPAHGNVICSVRIELADGRLARPTKLEPYTTPTPTGGEYRPPHGPHSPLRAVFVTAAKSSVPPGASCNYPVYGSLSINGVPDVGGDAKGLNANINVVSDPEPGSSEPMRLRLEVHITNPRIVICRAYMTAIPPHGNAETAKTYPVTITPGGIVTSEDVEVPSDYSFSGIVFARLG